MLTFEDCLALCDVNEKEVAAIAEHEHVPEMLALELGNNLIHTQEGELKIKKMIIDDINHALDTGKTRHAGELKILLQEFTQTHPGLLAV